MLSAKQDNVTSSNAATSHRGGIPTRRAKRRLLVTALIAATTITPVGGCGMFQRIPDGPHDTKASYHDNAALRIEYPEVAECATPPTLAAQATVEPHALENPAELPALEMTLEEAVRLAVQQSPVLRAIGGTIVTTPQSVRTIYDPALAHADPLLGVEAALSAFDAQYTQSLFWDSTDRPTNVLQGTQGAAFTPAVVQGLAANYAGELSKVTATGAVFSLRHIVNYNRDNQQVAFRRFDSTFTGSVEATWRQPLLQGAGTTFNRIAGPPNAPGTFQGNIPGRYQGVLVARVDEDIELAEFEAGVVQLVRDVEEAYWNLYTAYRVLEANLKGRESALQTFQYQQVRLEVGTGRLDEEAQARSQFYQFQAQVQESLAGPEGLYALEQQLRYLIGMPATDGSLIRPVTEPTDTRVVFDWESALGQAISRRVEIRRQRFSVKRRELELIAARLNVRPRLDLVGTYRWTGLGDNLIGDDSSNLIGSITGGDYQEWNGGVELSWPIGLRLASAALAHARLNLNRERAILAETELRVSHDLSAAAREIELSHELLETNYSRYLADLRQVDVLRRRYRDGTDNINFLLQAQRQVVTSETQFYQSLSRYNLALRDFHLQKGSLLAYNQVNLTEGPWAPGAYRDAYEAGRYLTPRLHPEEVEVGPTVTSGLFNPSAVQETSPSLDVPVPAGLPLPAPLPIEDVPEPPADAEASSPATGKAMLFVEEADPSLYQGQPTEPTLIKADKPRPPIGQVDFQGLISSEE